MTDATIVVPCYNEATRLDAEEFLRWSRQGRIGFLFVDDGSTDGTRGILDRMHRQCEAGVAVHGLPVNSGKAEAVRQGMLLALERGAAIVGYFDADLATPVPELIAMLDTLQAGRRAVALGSRATALGNGLERKWYRHLSGLLFGTLASWVLGTPFMDTQCGAKLFRSGSLLRAVLEHPFRTRWAFDVELLGRLYAGYRDLPGLPRDEVIEYRLRSWTDIRGSKLSLAAMVRTTLSLAGIWLDLRRWRRDFGGA